MSAFIDCVPNNQLLLSLPAEAAAAVRSRVQLVPLSAQEALCEADAELRHVYFPVTAVVSLVSSLQSGVGAEIAVVGHEGVVGVDAFMGARKCLSSAVVQHAGTAWRIGARDAAALAHEVAPLMQQVLRYTQVLFAQMAQTSVCHRHHSVAAQLSRWLLQHVDRQAGDELHVTHEGIAGMLGVRREGVTEAALALQRAGVIRYRRGHLQVLDRRGLGQHSCECYGAVVRAYGPLWGGGRAWPAAYGDHARPPARRPAHEHAPVAAAYA